MFSLAASAVVVGFVLAFILLLMAIPAGILMVLLGVLASLTGWSCALGFWPCFVIVLIIGLFIK